MKEGSKKMKVVNKSGGPISMVFFFAWIGALVYFVQRSEGFGGFLLAILKSVVWPAYVIHAVLKLLHV